MVNAGDQAPVRGREPLIAFSSQFFGNEALWTGAEEPSNNKKGQPGAPQGRPDKPSRLEGQLASR